MRKFMIIIIAFLKGRLLCLKDSEIDLKRKFLARIRSATGIIGIMDFVKKDATKTIVKTIMVSMTDFFNSSLKKPLILWIGDLRIDKGLLRIDKEKAFIN